MTDTNPMRCRHCQQEIARHEVYGLWLGIESRVHACPASQTGHQPESAIEGSPEWRQEVDELERLYARGAA